MRIVLCNAIYPTPDEPSIVGGAEVFVRQFAEGLVKDGDDVVVIRASRDGRRKSEVANGVTVHFLPIRNIFPPFNDKRNPLLRLAWHAIDDRWRAPHGFRQILEEFKPDIFHSHTLNGLSTDVWSQARALGIPVVHTLHDYYLTCPRCSRFKQSRTCAETCGSCRTLTSGRRGRSELIDAVTSVSRRTLDIHIENGVFTQHSRTHVITNVANAAIQPIESLPLQGPLRIGYIGRFAEEKGIRLLVEAAGRLPKGSVELILAGRASEEERNRLQAICPGLPLSFLGFVPPIEFYRQVHVTAVSSIWEEPGALVIADSLAAARPVVATDMGGAAEAIENGVTGWIVEPTAEALAAKFRELVEQPDLIAAAHSRLFSGIVSRRTFDDLIREYRSVYDKVPRKL